MAIHCIQNEEHCAGNGCREAKIRCECRLNRSDFCAVACDISKFVHPILFKIIWGKNEIKRKSVNKTFFVKRGKTYILGDKTPKKFIRVQSFDTTSQSNSHSPINDAEHSKRASYYFQLFFDIYTNN